MYKRSYPEALSLASLGRADSKIVDKTCHGITTAGKPCRKPLKKGSREKYCHLHKNQQATHQARLLGARTHSALLEEYDEDGGVLRNSDFTPTNTTKCEFGFPTPSPSPSPPRRKSPEAKPVSPIKFPPEHHVRPSSLQLPPQSSITPPTPPSSIHSPQSSHPPPRQKKAVFKIGNVMRRLFSSQKVASKHPKARPKDYAPEFIPSLGPAFRRNDLTPSRYPTTITPSGLPSSSHTPIGRPKAQNLTSSPTHTTKSTTPDIPLSQCRPHTQALAQTRSRSATHGVQKSWETMWVPGIDGLGAHIICKEWLSPQLSAVGRQKLLSCMRAPLSAGEESGYIYAYKIAETAPQESVYYKVGRTQNLTRRLYQWSRSCPYTPLLVEFFPAHPVNTLRRTPSTNSVSSRSLRTETNERPSKVVKCAVTHRVERLIHLELEDRFGRVDSSQDECFCGKFHKEWFRGGTGDEGGWPEVKDVIIRWVGFAQIAYGEITI